MIILSHFNLTPGNQVNEKYTQTLSMHFARGAPALDTESASSTTPSSGPSR